MLTGASCDAAGPAEAQVSPAGVQGHSFRVNTQARRREHSKAFQPQRKTLCGELPSAFPV
jgi:hypothetical protein